MSGYIWTNTDQHNKAGIPLKITGGFGYEIEDGGYSAAWDSPGASIQINEDSVARQLDRDRPHTPCVPIESRNCY
jgi:hypothetical protein